MPKLTKEQQSAIGRSSRRKGKSFERMMAGRYREWFKNDWQTTRNSGRTDLPGDIYCVERQAEVHVECKHRKDWKIPDIIKVNKGYAQELKKVLGEWEEVWGKYPTLHVWNQNDLGLWLLEMRTNGTKGVPVKHSGFTFDCEIVNSAGHQWRRVTGLRSGYECYCHPKAGNS